MEFLRQDLFDQSHISEEEREKIFIWKLLIGNCKLEDSKMEKNANFELVPQAGEKYFSCDMMKGQVNSGQETIVSIKFNPPKQDPLLKDIVALKGIG